MKTPCGNNKKNRTRQRLTNKSRNSSKQLLPALMAVGGACGMMAAPAAALELGSLKINSSLGQPLRASISYALNRREELYDFCVYLRPGLAANGLPVLSRATVSIADGVILLTGSRAIREPLLTMQVSIDCPYTAHISREYTLMINPPIPVIREGPIVVEPSATRESIATTVAATESGAATAVTTVPRAATTVTTESRATTTAAQARKPRRPYESRRNLDQSPISESSRYLVQRGDSLSDITSRISDRSIALWPAVDRIFAANPNAFIDGDMNLLKAGSWLDIPDLSITAKEPTLSVAVQEPMSFEADSTLAGTSESDAVEFAVYTGYEATAPADAGETITAAYDSQGPAVTDVTETEEISVAGPDPGGSDFARPGDVILDNDTSFVSPIGAEADGAAIIDIPDTEIVEPAVRPVPVVNTSQSNDTPGKTSGSWSWLVWLGGTGLALILGLLLFGQRFRQKFGSVAVGAASEPLQNRRRTDAISDPAEAEQDIDFEVPDESPQSAYMTLDADFDDGSGLQDGSDMDVAQDFGFSASNSLEEELDMVIPEGADVEESLQRTDMMSTINPTANILDSEIMPSDDDDYEMAMIVDVTKQDVVQSDATEKDLQAVQVEAESEPKSDDLTLNQVTDYKTLEQDYEAQLTATQVLNAEIEKAAAELADHMGIDATGEMIAKLPENTHAVNDDGSDSGVTANVTGELPGSDDELTVDMPATDDQVTFELEVDSDAVETEKKKKAS